MQADANDYIEKEFGAFYRSYPAQGGDALAYQRDGFLWNAAEAAGQDASKAYGEYNNFLTEPPPARPGRTTTRTRRSSRARPTGRCRCRCRRRQHLRRHPVAQRHRRPPVPGVRPRHPRPVPRRTSGSRSFAKSEKTGTAAQPQPDLDAGRPHRRRRHRRPVPGRRGRRQRPGRRPDHRHHLALEVSGAARRSSSSRTTPRTAPTTSTATAAPLLVASPYAKRGVVDNTYYTQLNVVKTIEQILGIAPMNQEDRAAEPMSTRSPTRRTSPRTPSCRTRSRSPRV